MDEKNTGSVRISEDVITSIAAKAAMEIDGVVGVPTKVYPNAKTFLGNVKQSFLNGVNIVSTPEGLELALQLVVRHGVKIQQIASDVQTNVGDTVQSMTGLSVHSVNVVVVAVAADKQVSK